MPHSVRVSAAATQLVVLAGVAIAAIVVRAAFDLTDWYVVKAVAAFGVAAILILSRIEGHHPFERFGPANQITTVRAGLVALTAGALGDPTVDGVAGCAAGAALIATCLDGVDGFAARRSRMAGAFGARFDLETDAALIQVLALLVWQYGKAGPWVVASGLLRYLFVAAGWVWPWMRRPLPASFRGKLICVVQIAALTIALLPQIEPAVSVWIAGAGLIALCYSFVVDTLWLRRQSRTP
jgi:phosphatidylglycerophosphate synthase